MLIQAAAEQVGLTNADTVFHGIVGVIIAVMGIGRTVDLLERFGVIPERRPRNGKSVALSELQVMTIVRKELEPLSIAIGQSGESQCEILREIRDHILIVAEDTRQRQIAARIHK